MAKPTIVAAPNRGNYSVKGTPNGIKIPKAPTAGSVVKGAKGVDFVYRPGGPKGAGYYKKAKPTPSITSFNPTTGSNASGSTIQTPVVDTTPPAPTTTTTTTSTPPTPAWWNTQIGAGIASNAMTPILGAEQNQIGSTYGLVLRRDLTEGSETKGQPLYRLPTEASGAGTVRQTGFNEKGDPVYKDGAGNVVTDIAGLVLDYSALKAGDPGYLQGAIGNAAATSQKNQFSIADAAARSGVRRSGMSGEASAEETRNAQNLNSSLLQRAGGDYTTNLGKWASLYNQIYQGLLPKAEALAAPVETTTEVPVAPEAPVVDTTAPTPSAASSGSGFFSTVTPDAGGALSPGPNGEFMKLLGNVTLERNTSDKAIREALNGVLNNPKYKLTAQQRNYIKSLITGRYKGNKKY